jgi:hypothetical protein
MSSPKHPQLLLAVDVQQLAEAALNPVGDDVADRSSGEDAMPTNDTGPSIRAGEFVDLITDLKERITHRRSPSS